MKFNHFLPLADCLRSICNAILWPSIGMLYLMLVLLLHSGSVRAQSDGFPISVTPCASVGSGYATLLYLGSGVASPGYDYHWYKGTDYTGTYIGTSNFSTGAIGVDIGITEPGNYVCYVTVEGYYPDPVNFFYGSEVITIGERSVSAPIISTPSTLICSGIPVTLTSNIAETSWYLNNEPIGTGSTIQVTSEGTYKANSVTECGTSEWSNELYISFTPVPVTPTIYSDQTAICSGSSTTLRSNGTNIYWYRDGELFNYGNEIIVTQAGSYYARSSNGCDQQQSYNNYSGSQIYYADSEKHTRLRSEIQPANALSDPSNSITITVIDHPAAPTAVSASAGSLNCDANSGTITVNASSVHTLSYSLDGVNYQASNVFTACPGNYTVTVKATNACGSATVSTTVSVIANPLPPTHPPVVSVSQISCGETTGTITVSGPAAIAGTTLEYSLNDGVSWQSGNSFVNVSPGTYSIRMRAMSTDTGCYSDQSLPTLVTVGPVPEIPQAPVYSIIQPDCLIAAGVVTINEPTGAGYTYSMDGISFYPTTTFGGLVPGSYSLYAKNEYGCVSTPSGFVISSRPSSPETPVLSVSGSTTFCNGGSVTLSAPAGYTYLWNSGQTSREIVITSGGSYRVAIYNENGCSATSAFTTITILPVPEKPVISSSGPTAFCEGGSVTLTAPAGAAYLWSNGATSKNITVSTTGTYSVTVTNANGCSSVSDSIHVSKMLIAVNGQRVFCQGESVSLYASNDFNSYQWYRNGNAIASPAGASISINASETGVYTVQGSVSGGSCISLPFQLSSFASPQISISSTANQIDSISYENCGPARFAVNVTDPDNSGQPVVSFFKVEYDDGSITATEGNTITLTKSAVMEVRAVSAAGCSVTRTFSFLMNDNISIPPVIASGPTTFCEGESVTLTAPDGYTYLWSNGATSQSISINTTGEYNVKVTNSDGCFSFSNPVLIMVNPLNSSK